MKRRFIIITILSALLLSFSYKSATQNTKLFKIERSRDANQIFYEVQTILGNKLNTENPINIYWLRKTEGNKIKPLTWIQQKFAYGLSYTFVSDSLAKFHFVSYDKKDFYLMKDNHDNFRVFTKLNNQFVIVDRIYIHLTGGTFWVPKIPKIELHATVPKSKEKIVEIVKPN